MSIVKTTEPQKVLGRDSTQGFVDVRRNKASNVRRNARLDEVVVTAVAMISTGFGIDDEDRTELTLASLHPAQWRKA